MKLSSAAAVASIAAFASAQTVADFPPCALDCLANAFPITGCSPTDIFCACSNGLFVAGSAACIQRNCPNAEQQRGLAAAAALCRANGVDIPTTFPSPAPTASATGASASRSARTTRQATGVTTGRSTRTTFPTTLPTATAFAGNATSNITRPTTIPGNISSGAERLTTALTLVGLSIAAVCFSL